MVAFQSHHNCKTPEVYLISGALAVAGSSAAWIVIAFSTDTVITEMQGVYIFYCPRKVAVFYMPSDTISTRYVRQGLNYCIIVGWLSRP